MHGLHGCDTMSATFGHGKANLLKKIQVSEEVQQIARLMGDFSVKPEEIGRAGIHLFLVLFGGKDGDSLNSLHYVKLEMVSASKVVDPHKLPPTERAAYFYSLRVHLQVMLWKMLTTEEYQFDPEKWGLEAQWY